MLQKLNYKRIIICFVFVSAAFLIVFRFTDTPKVWVDEGILTSIARSVASSGVFGLQTQPGSFFQFGALLTTNYPVIFPVAVSIKLFGTGIWQARLPMILYMFVLVVLFYLYTKKKYGFYPAILSVLMLISFSPFYGNGRPVQGEVPGLVFLCLGAIMLLYFEETNFENKKFAILAGLFLGLAAVTKSLYLLLLCVILPLSLFFWIKKIKNKKNILILLLAFITPIFFWFVINFPTPDLITKIIPTMVSQSGNNGPSSLSNTSLSLVETVSVNLFRFVTESTPVLFLFLFIVLVFFFGRKYFKKDKSDFSISEFLLFFVIFFNWLGYLLGTGWYRYFFPANVLLYLFFPIAIITLAKKVSNEYVKKITMLIPVVLILFQFFHLIFLSDTSFFVSRTRNIILSQALSVVPSSQKVFFYNSPEAVVFLKGDNYFQYLTVQGLFEAGDKNALTDMTKDFILTENNPEYGDMLSPCYTKRELDSYILFQKTVDCKNKK